MDEVQLEKNEQRKEYYKQNKARILEIQKTYYQKHRKERIQYQKK